MNCTSIYSMLIVDPEMKSSPNTSLSHFFPIPPLPSLFHVSHLFPISSRIYFCLFFFLNLRLLYFQLFHSLLAPLVPIIPHLTITIPPIIPLNLWLFFSHYSPSYRYNSSNHSCPLLTLILSIFFPIILVLRPLHISLQFSSCSAYKKGDYSSSFF